MLKQLFYLSAFLFTIPLAAQNTNDIDYIYKLKKITSFVKIDGVPDDKDWASAQEAKNFILMLR
jgi:hypothetical protein